MKKKEAYSPVNKTKRSSKKPLTTENNEVDMQARLVRTKGPATASPRSTGKSVLYTHPTIERETNDTDVYRSLLITPGKMRNNSKHNIDNIDNLDTVDKKSRHREKVVIGIQNLRGLGHDEDKIEDLTRAMEENNMGIAMVTETWKESTDDGRLDSGHLFISAGISRRRGCRGTQGVGFLLSPKMATIYEESGRQFEDHGGRLATLRLPVKKTGRKGDFHLYLVVVYAPISTVHGARRQSFMDNLQGLMEKKREGGILVVGGDFNAAMGGEPQHLFGATLCDH
jgi:hypothetical protein